MKPIHQKISDEGKCRVCEAPDSIHALDPAHVIPRSLGGKNNYDSVIPLCRACHEAQHRNELEITPYLTREEHAEAAYVLGIPRAYRYLTKGGDHA